MSDVKPIQKWEDEHIAIGEGVVWFTRLDERYLIEVRRTENKYIGLLLIFDKEKDFKCIATSDVRLSYGAVFGPDIDDVRAWQETVIKFIDEEYKDAK